MRNKRIAEGVCVALLLAVQICVCVCFGTQKNTLFCDETYSYGLANSTDYAFLDNVTSSEYSTNHGWVDSSYYKNYVMVKPGDGLASFKAPYVNQVADVHPPIYYYFLHLVCFFFKGSFSKWTGIGLNIFFMLVGDFVMYYIASYFFGKDRFKSIMPIILWSMSAAGISNVLYIRMYMLQTVEIMLYIAVHIWIEKHGKFDIKGYFLVYAAFVLGGLTHYYFYPFAFFFSAPICFYFFLRKKIELFVKYSASLCLAFFTNLVLFPATLKHVFGGYRGTEVASNLKGGSENVFTAYYKEWIDNSVFGGTMKIFIVILAAMIVFSIVRYIIKSKGKDKLSVNGFKNFVCDVFYLKASHKALIYILSSIAIVGFAYIAIVGSNLHSNRYIYPIYPMVSIWIMSVVYWVFGTFIKKDNVVNVIAAACVVVLCAASIHQYGIDFMYPNYPEAEESAKKLEGYDCLQYYGSAWIDVYTALPLKFQYDETRFFDDDDLKDIDKILDYRETKDPVAVNFIGVDDSTAERVLNAIIDKTDYTGYELVYDYKGKMYELKS